MEQSAGSKRPGTTSSAGKTSPDQGLRCETKGPRLLGLSSCQ